MIDFDFNVNNFVLDICESTERFSLCGGVMRLQELIIPKIGDSVRFMSGIGDFSSCCVLLRISEQTNIHSIVLSTLRCGKKEVDALEDLQIPSVHIICGSILAASNDKSGQMEYLESKANQNGWYISCMRNHSKIMLLDTDRGKIVIETSSNFNENPKIEQFCVMNSESVYDWYINTFKKITGTNIIHDTRDGN